MVLEVWDIYEWLGSLEGELVFVQLVFYLVSIVKLNVGYVVFNQVKVDVCQSGIEEVLLYLCNVLIKLMKGLGYGVEYQYDYDVEGGIVLDQMGFFDVMGEWVYYNLVLCGLEIKLKEKLDWLCVECEVVRVVKGC